MFHQRSRTRLKLFFFGLVILYILYKINIYLAIPTLYLITPTYDRPEQIPEFLRLVQYLKDVSHIYWIIVEDAHSNSPKLINFLKAHNVKNYVLLNIKTPQTLKVDPKNPGIHWVHPRGVFQRNLGLNWLFNYSQSPTLARRAVTNGVIYFMDDDNTYDPRIFEEMRYTQRVSVWPVGLVGGLLVETPIVDPVSKKVIDFNSMWHRENRRFPLDMAAFAINFAFWLQQINAKTNDEQSKSNFLSGYFSPQSRIGEMENDFLTGLRVTLQDLEPRAELCSKVLVWHTKSWPAKLNQEALLQKLGKRPSDYQMKLF